MRKRHAISLSQHDLIWLRRVKEIIETRFHESLSLKLLCKETGISKSKLTSGFKMQSGLSVHQYLTDTRMAAAKSLLQDGELPTKAIASQCGYRNVKSFITAFKKHTGQTVRQFLKTANPPGEPFSNQ